MRKHQLIMRQPQPGRICAPTEDRGGLAYARRVAQQSEPSDVRQSPYGSLFIAWREPLRHLSPIPLRREA